MNIYLNKDCMNNEVGIVTYPDNYFALGIVDCQFGIGEDGRKKRREYAVQKNGKKLKVACVQDSVWDNEQPPQAFFDELFRVCKKVIIWGCNYIQFDQKESSSGRIIWDKVNGSNDFSDCEIAFTNLFSSVRQVEYMWNGMMQGKSIKHGRIQQGNKKLNEKRIQACQKPVLLYRWLLTLPNIPEGILLDTHVGSASSLIAFEKEGYEYVAYEKDKSHFDKSLQRPEWKMIRDQKCFAF